MVSTWWLDDLTYISFALEVVALILIVRSQSVARWRAVFCSLALDIVTTICLCALLHATIKYRYAYYFYVYWITSATQSLLRVWIATDILRTFPRISECPDTLKLFAGVLSAGLAFFCAMLALQSTPRTGPMYLHHPGVPIGPLLASTAITLNRAVSLAWLGFIATALAIAKTFAFSWSSDGAGVAQAFSLRVCASALVAEMLTNHSRTVHFWASGLDAAVNVAMITALCFAFLRRYRRATPQDLESAPRPVTRQELESALMLLQK